jgi:EAL domain-containing protein (putative c-di-GMP-specific phosphodiesterase class I)
MNQHRLLILDDDPKIGPLISSIAKSAGFTAQVAITPGQFFEKYESWMPTHIILDLIMPDMDGVEVLVELSRRDCRAGILIISGAETRVLDAAGRSATEHGLSFVGALTKPFTSARLRQLLLDSKKGSDRLAEVGSKVSPAKYAEPITAEAFNRALGNGELELAYQPKIFCRNNHLAGFEALVRWNCPERGTLSPESFIPIAESSGLMARMTRLVIENALTWFKGFLDGIDESDLADRQQKHSIRELTISINLSARSLDDPEFFAFVTDQCHRTVIEPSRVIFELTETSAMQNPVASLEVLTHLRVRGFQLSIDDFGSGFSSMIQLVRLPFSEVKVDKSFVMGASRSNESRSVIRSIVELGHSLGLLTTAEGVEDIDTFDYLNQIGCDCAQGYLFSHPLGSQEAREWARSHLVSWR